MSKIDFAYTPVLYIIGLFISSIFLPTPYNLLGCILLYLSQYFLGIIRPIGLWIRANKTDVSNIDSAASVYSILNTVFFLSLLFASVNWSWSIIVGMSLIWGLTSGTIGLSALHEMSHRKGWSGILSGMYAMHSHYKLQHIHHHRHYGTEKDSSWPKMGTTFYKQLFYAVPKKQVDAFKINPSLYIKCMLLNLVFPVLSIFIGLKAFVFVVLYSLIDLVVAELQNYILHYGLSKDMPEGFRCWNYSSKEIYNIFAFNVGLHEKHHETGLSNYSSNCDQFVASLPEENYKLMFLSFFPKLFFKKMHNRMMNGFASSKFEGLNLLPKQLEKLNV